MSLQAYSANNQPLFYNHTLPICALDEAKLFQSQEKQESVLSFAESPQLWCRQERDKVNLYRQIFSEKVRNSRFNRNIPLNNTCLPREKNAEEKMAHLDQADRELAQLALRAGVSLDKMLFSFEYYNSINNVCNQLDLLIKENEEIEEKYSKIQRGFEEKQSSDQFLSKIFNKLEDKNLLKSSNSALKRSKPLNLTCALNEKEQEEKQATLDLDDRELFQLWKVEGFTLNQFLDYIEAREEFNQALSRLIQEKFQQGNSNRQISEFIANIGNTLGSLSRYAILWSCAKDRTLKTCALPVAMNTVPPLIHSLSKNPTALESIKTTTEQAMKTAEALGYLTALKACISRQWKLCASTAAGSLTISALRSLIFRG